MPKTLTPNNNFPANIPNFPLSGNNEPLALGPLEAAIQAVLDRTESLHQSRLTVEGAGVKRVQKVASLAALQNLAGMSDGDTVDVEGYGRYRLYNPSALAADGLWVLNSASGGRWVHLLNSMKGANSGLATLTGAGRLAQDVRDNSILTQHLGDGQVTGPKLAGGAVVAHLGYTPVNRAGDTMTGNLALQATDPTLALRNAAAVQMGRVIYAGNNTAGNRHVSLVNDTGDFLGLFSLNNTPIRMYTAGTERLTVLADGRTQLYGELLAQRVRALGTANSGNWPDAQLEVQGAPSGSGAPNATPRIAFHLPFAAASQFGIFPGTTSGELSAMNQDGSGYVPIRASTYRIGATTVIDSSRNIFAGVIQGRYDHVDRFVFSGTFGENGFSISAGATLIMARFPVEIPLGRNLVLRRVRYSFWDSNIRLRIQTSMATYTSASNEGDVALNTVLRDGGQRAIVLILAFNAATFSNPLQHEDTFWLELEIV